MYKASKQAGGSHMKCPDGGTDLEQGYTPCDGGKEKRAEGLRQLWSWPGEGD